MKRVDEVFGDVLESDGEMLSPATYVPTVTRDFPSFPPIEFVTSNKHFPMQESNTQTQVEAAQDDETKKMMERVELLSMDDTVPTQFGHVVEAIVVAGKLLRIVTQTNKFDDLIELYQKCERISNGLAKELGGKEMKEGVQQTTMNIDTRTVAILRAISDCWLAQSQCKGKMANFYGFMTGEMIKKINEAKNEATKEKPEE